MAECFKIAGMSQEKSKFWMKKKMFGIVSKVIANDEILTKSLNLVKNDKFTYGGSEENIKLWTDIILPVKYSI